MELEDCLPGSFAVLQVIKDSPRVWSFPFQPNQDSRNGTGAVFCIPHSALYTPLSTLRPLHFTLHTLHSTLYTLHFTLHTLHSTLHTPHTTHRSSYPSYKNKWIEPEIPVNVKSPGMIFGFPRYPTMDGEQKSWKIPKKNGCPMEDWGYPHEGNLHIMKLN